MSYIKLFISSILLLTIAVQFASAQEKTRPADGMFSYTSEYSVNETMKRLVTELQDNGMKIFQTVDHSAGARSADMKLQPTKLVIFGNPNVGTPLMQCSRTVAIDLPQKMLIWEDDSGNVHIGYNDPNYLDVRHQLDSEKCRKMLKKVGKALDRFASHAAGMD